MSIIKNIIFMIYNIIFLALCGIIVSIAVGFSAPLEMINQAFATPLNRMISGTLAILLIFLIIIILIKGLRRTSLPDNVDLSNNDIGNVAISTSAIKNFILKTVKQIDGVKEVKTQVLKGDGGVNISLHMMVNPEKNLPELSSLTQTKVKEYLEQVVGLKVAEIKILVDDIKSALK